MMGGMDSISSSMVKLALDAAALRHQAIANNIANLHSEGYVPLTVNFEAQLEAVRRGRAPSSPEIVEQDRLPGPRPQDVDVEMVALAQNTIHYQALMRALGVQFSTLGDAISDGRKA